MKTKVSCVKRLGACLLAVMFFLQAFLGLLPAKEAKAASGIGEWDEQQLVDYQYRFNVKFQPGVTKAVPFGCDNQDSEALSNHGRNSVNAVVTNRMTAGYVPDSAGIRYYNVGKDQDGNIVDFQVSVVSVTNAEPRYDMFTPYTKYHLWKDEKEDTGQGYDWEDGMGQPVVGFALEQIGVFIYCIGSAKVHFQFFKHNTEEPLFINGHGTVRDLDAGQGASVPEDSGIDYAYILKGNTFLEKDGSCVTAGTDALASSDKRGWLNFLYQNTELNFNFLHQSRLDRWDTERENGIAKRGGSVEKWAAALRKLYADPDGNSYCPNYDGGKIVRGHAY